MSTALGIYLTIATGFLVTSLYLPDIRASLAQLSLFWRAVNLTLIFFGWPVLVLVGLIVGTFCTKAAK